MSVQITGINELNERLRQYQKAISKPREKTGILAAGAQKIRLAASKAPTPKSGKDHYYYYKGQKKLIKAGNLRKSMKVYRGKEGDVYVGPRFKRSLSGIGTVGATAASSSGYYAHMIYKTASAFRTRIMERAAVAAAVQTFKAIERQFEKFHIRQPAAQ
jgi:hypothetical protein